MKEESHMFQKFFLFKALREAMKGSYAPSTTTSYRPMSTQKGRIKHCAERREIAKRGRKRKFYRELRARSS